MNFATTRHEARILLVEDNPADVRLTQEVVREGPVNIALDVARDGEVAMQMLRRKGDYATLPRPDLILLDLNLPRKDGREVLVEIKSDPELRTIPVIMLTTSAAETDVLACYEAHANSFITKPIDLDEFSRVIEVIEEYWLRVVRLRDDR